MNSEESELYKYGLLVIASNAKDYSNKEYRLGDFVNYLCCSRAFREEGVIPENLLKRFKHKLLVQFAIHYSKSSRNQLPEDRKSIFKKLVSFYAKRVRSRMPRKAAVHLRAGDVKQDHPYYIPPSRYKSAFDTLHEAGVRNVDFFSGHHLRLSENFKEVFPRHIENDHPRCPVLRTAKYAREVMKLFEHAGFKTSFNSIGAEEDLLEMSRYGYFIQSSGSYSKLIATVTGELGSTIINI